MTELFINQKLNQLLEIDYDYMPENPLDMVDGDGFSFHFEARNLVSDLIDEIFNGNEGAYQAEHDKYRNVNGLFKGLNALAEKRGKLILPITKYEHSQVRYYLGADQDWDSGVTGFVLVDLEQVKIYYSLTGKTEIKEFLENMLDSYTEYANGNVYRAAIYELNSKGEIDDDVDFVGNLLPDDANLEGLFDLGLAGGDLKDWKKATKRVVTSYISVGE